MYLACNTEGRNLTELPKDDVKFIFCLKKSIGYIDMYRTEMGWEFDKIKGSRSERKTRVSLVQTIWKLGDTHNNSLK